MKKDPQKKKPSDPSNPQEPKHVLGRIPEGASSSELEQGPAHIVTPSDATPVKGLSGLHKPDSGGKTSPPPAAPHAPTDDTRYGPPGPDTSGDSLTLPAGGLVAMRKSGGLRFTSREVVVYSNGRVAASGNSGPGSAGAAGAASTHKLNDADLARLYRAIEGANLVQPSGKAGRQNPDAYAYEIVAHIAGANHSVEAFDGAIPQELAPLIQLLAGYM